MTQDGARRDGDDAKCGNGATNCGSEARAPTRARRKHRGCY